jgi:glycosyltransferase involved in cell wall biosynthesis
MFLELGRQFDRRRFELFLIVTRPWHYGLASRWADAVDHVYDFGCMAEPERMQEALHSLAVNWRWDGLVLQNNLDAYSVLPALKQALPKLRVIDVLHNVHDDWDYFSATTAVAESIDRRVSVSRAGGQRLASLGCPREKIRVIYNGIDLDRFNRQRFEPGALHRRLGLPLSTRVILFAGNLVNRKRPALLVDIDREMCRLRSAPPYCFVVAGEGPESAALASAIRSGACGDRFRLLGHVDCIAPLLADTSVLVLPSIEEGVPLVINEALAMEVPVASSRVGAIEEALPPACGVLIENDGREAQSFASTLCELLRDPARREKLGTEGRRFVEIHYDLRRARQQYRDLIEETFPARGGADRGANRSRETKKRSKLGID